MQLPKQVNLWEDSAWVIVTEVVDSVLASCLHTSHKRDGEQTSEFLGHILEQDVVNEHVPQCYSATPTLFTLSIHPTLSTLSYYDLFMFARFALSQLFITLYIAIACMHVGMWVRGQHIATYTHIQRYSNLLIGVTSSLWLTPIMLSESYE